MKRDFRFYSYFLPQFHECPFNNQWWGEGFTEWDNVRNAKPLFVGHRQPKVPAQGYFDLSKEGVIESQYETAREHGIDGFIFYHYWYEGRRPLAKPLDMVLANKDMDVRFGLCWANHSWTRSWQARAGSLDVLIEQTYEQSHHGRRIHYHFLHGAFVDSRYIRVDGRPYFQIYIPQDIPHLSRFVDELRAYCLAESRTEIHLSAVVANWIPKWDLLRDFDSVTLNQPGLAFYSPDDVFSGIRKAGLNSGLGSAVVRALPLPLKKLLYPIQDRMFNKISFFDYRKTWDKASLQTANALRSGLRIMPSAFVDFDNTARYKGRARMLRGFEPELFGDYVWRLANLIASDAGENVLFINAWNEWGEGMYLQDDIDFGNARLMQIQRVKSQLQAGLSRLCGADERQADGLVAAH